MGLRSVQGGKMKKRNKAYKPRNKFGCTIMFKNTDSVAEVGVLAWSANMKIRHGEADIGDLGTISARLHQGYEIAKVITSVETAEPVAYLESAILAAKSMLDRHGAIDRIGGTGEELTAITRGLEMVDLLHGAATRRELAASITAMLGNLRLMEVWK